MRFSSYFNDARDYNNVYENNICFIYYTKINVNHFIHINFNMRDIHTKLYKIKVKKIA